LLDCNEARATITTLKASINARIHLSDFDIFTFSFIQTI